MSRKPNTVCMECGTPIYCRPGQMDKQKSWFCSTGCFRRHRGGKKVFLCPFCGGEFHSRKDRKYCSRICANKARRGITYGKNSQGNKSRQRFNTLRGLFKFDTCMIDTCNYGRTFTVHRLIPGCRGGNYVVGNMFAICPNHHAEIHSNIITVEKINDMTLRVVKDTSEGRKGVSLDD